MPDVDSGTIRRIAGLGCWSGKLAVEQLKGGLSNESFLVTDAEKRAVVRFGSDFPFHHVFREREAMAARAAHAAGIAPEVIHAGPGFMVCAWVDARTYGAEDVRANAERIVDLVRRFHKEMLSHVDGPGFMFWVFHVIRDYARTLKRAGSRKTGDLPRFLALAEELEAVQVPLPIVFGHNDLLPANFLDDGERLWLIDFEYAGFSTAMFDLAGMASNAEFDAEASDALLERYFEAKPASVLKRSLAAMQCASLLREAMWSMVSEHYLEAPGADYVAYTEENLAKLDRAIDAYRVRWGKA
jgi:thiamine kinase-like enzyme